MPRQGFIFFIFLCTLVFTPRVSAQNLVEDQNTLIILAYEDIDQSEQSTKALSWDQFAHHIKILASSQYTILPLPDALATLQSGRSLPPRCVAITLEGGYHSALKASKMLQNHDLPFTVFYAADKASRTDPQYLSWADLQRIKQYKGASFGVLGASFSSMALMTQQESLSLLNRARSAHKEHLEEEVDILSYPFGHWSLTLQESARMAGFTFALTLDPGAAHVNSDFLALPRFEINADYEHTERLDLILESLPFPITDATPQDPLLVTDMPSIGFTVPKGLDLSDLSCFIAYPGHLRTEIIGEHRIEMRLNRPISSSFTRLTCLVSEKSLTDQEIRFRWYGRIFLSPKTEQEENDFFPAQ